MEKGQKVQVREYGGKLLIRRVVVDRGRSIVICNEAENSAAMKEKREPEGVGFPRDQIKPLV